MKHLHATQTWEVTLLTPLHIGDGEEMQENLDYVFNRGALEVLDLEALLEGVALANPKAFWEMGRDDFSLPRFFKDHGVGIKSLYTLPLSGGPPPRSLRRFLKNGFGLPYVPGSSLKGALRTALLTPNLRARAQKKALPPAASFRDFERAVERVAGPDPNHDLFRPLQVSDSAGLEASCVLRAEEVKFFNIAEGNKAGWKDFSSRRTLRSPAEAAGVYVEALKAGTVFHMQAALDGFLGDPTVRRALAYGSGNSGFDTFAALATTVNEHSRRLAERELDFFKQFGAGTPGPVAFLDQLLARMKGAEGGSFFLRLAWGSGWRGMTGDWLEGPDLETIRREKNLGKSGCPQCKGRNVRRQGPRLVCQQCGHTFSASESWTFPTFPKTRRLAVDGGIPSLPLGWVQVKPSTPEMFAGKSLDTVAGAVERRIHGAARKEGVVSAAGGPSGLGQDISMDRGTAQPEPNPANLANQKLEIFLQRLEATSNLPGEMEYFVEIIRSAEENESKMQMAGLLLERARKLPKKKYAKSLSEGKQWAKALETLCRELWVP